VIVELEHRFCKYTAHWVSREPDNEDAEEVRLNDFMPTLAVALGDNFASNKLRAFTLKLGQLQELLDCHHRGLILPPLTDKLPKTMVIRSATPEDAEICGQICYDAFYKVGTEHNFPPDVPAPSVGVDIMRGLFSHPGFYCIVAEQDGRIIGSNCLDERDSVAGIGPITVDPAAQNSRVGRQLMEAVLQRAASRNPAGIRLVQAAFHNRSLSLYTKLGFDAREPLSVMQGAALGKKMDGCSVRPAQLSDLEVCNRVCLSVHGHHRGGELTDAINRGTATVVERSGKIAGYATSMAFFAHAAALSNLDLQALIGAAESFAGPGILVPTRNAELFRWCLESGLRVVEPMTLMTIGLYNEPVGAYLPSVSY
jgi:predicted N-acetyltransferase YhbS